MPGKPQESIIDSYRNMGKKIVDHIMDESKKSDKKVSAANQHVSQLTKKSTKKKRHKDKQEEIVQSDSKIIKLPEFI